MSCSAKAWRRANAVAAPGRWRCKGNCWDNAVVESFFGTMKAELENDTSGASRAEARSAVADYIDNFYNTTRRHSSLGYLSPINYEASVRIGRAA